MMMICCFKLLYYQSWTFSAYVTFSATVIKPLESLVWHVVFSQFVHC